MSHKLQNIFDFTHNHVVSCQCNDYNESIHPIRLPLVFWLFGYAATLTPDFLQRFAIGYQKGFR